MANCRFHCACHRGERERERGKRLSNAARTANLKVVINKTIAHVVQDQRKEKQRSCESGIPGQTTIICVQTTIPNPNAKCTCWVIYSYKELGKIFVSISILKNDRKCSVGVVARESKCYTFINTESGDWLSLAVIITRN